MVPLPDCQDLIGSTLYGWKIFEIYSSLIDSPPLSRRYSRDDIELFWSQGQCKVDIEGELRKIANRHEVDSEWKLQLDMMFDDINNITADWGLDDEDLEYEE